ncbi:MAG: peptidyl-prolyl cis-trans isomerase [Candidatus Aegiribacteria sp.]|nr:peptidyl-prolyl cis-trans isomerase [Candidatus Aegiribacteria sp.]
MARIRSRTIAGFCLAPLLVLSCGAYEEAGENTLPDPDGVIVTTDFPDTASTGDTEFISAAHILIKWHTTPEDSGSADEDDAMRSIRRIQDEILSGQVTFEEMAFNYSHCTSAADSGRLPVFTSGGITEELDSTIAALEPGEISGIIRTRFGYHLVKRLGS